MKKILAIVLAFAMVISGVYFGTSNKGEVQASTDVSTDMLDVKVQIAVDDSDVIRFITSVDSLDYYKVRFEVTTPSGTKTFETKTVYERIVSIATGDEYEFSPKVVDLSSEYFVTAMLRATTGVDYTVRAFVRTRDDVDTKVYGPSRTVALGDAEKDTINMMVDFTTAASAAYDVYDGDTKIGTAIVLADKNVRITLTSKTVDDFPSATKLTFKSGSTEVGTAVYRNYYTSYAKDGADTTWYTIDTSANDFIIASSADFYGLAKIINDQIDTTEFANDTVTLIRNVVVNEDMTNPTYEWTRIGTNTNGFAGTFDGDFNTISGILDVVAGSGGNGQAHGLFGSIPNSATLKNFKLDDSKFEFISVTGNSYGNNNAAVCGYAQGNLENIYVGTGVTIDTNVSGVGGFVGMNSLTSTTYTPNTIKNCWFAGTITGTTGAIGGIVGWGYRGSTILENCLNTGTVVVTGAGTVGGLVGQTSGSSTAESGNTLQKNRMTITNSISVGTVKSANTSKAGSVIGYLANTETNIENVYTTNVVECTVEGSGFSTSNSADGLGTWNAHANVTIKGLPIVDEDGSILNGTGAYLNTEFDFWSSTNEDGIWMAVKGKTPVIKKLSDVVGITTLTGTRASEGWYYAAFERAGVANAAMTRADAATYELDSAADLNGFAKIDNDTTNTERFNSDTIKLTANIDLNPGWVPSVDANGVLQNIPANKWEPIGKQPSEATTNFNGIFDGQGHTITGVYVDATTRDAGLFGITQSAAQILNLRMSNSYIKNRDYDWTGAVSGCFRGALVENVYVDDSVTIYAKGQVGGITGMHSLNRTHNISKCWFDGNIFASGTQVAGITARSYAGTTTIQNCLFSGNITSTNTGNAYVGGVVGDAQSSATMTNVSGCLSMGTIKVSSTSYTNSVIGRVQDTTKATLTNIYTTNNIAHISNASATFTATEGSTVVTEDAIKSNAKTALPLLYTIENETTKVWGVDTVGMPIIVWK